MTVYIEEAHPIEGWMYGAVTHQIHQHQTFQDRKAAACILQEELDNIVTLKHELPPPPIFVDGMDNMTSIAFGALPERLAILLNGKVNFIGGKGPEEYSVIECRRALEKLLCDD